VIAQVADAGPADVEAAVAQARAVFDDGTWARLPGGQRARILWRIADLIEEHAGELARLETRDLPSMHSPKRRVSSSDSD
jgi:acyl-CoA reductase-like NAD-dependent aldehyde dehydrogenase